MPHPPSPQSPFPSRPRSHPRGSGSGPGRPPAGAACAAPPPPSQIWASEFLGLLGLCNRCLGRHWLVLRDLDIQCGIELNFPAEYPFKPPKITFKTKIYHPNIDEKGQVCLPVISAENWKPATKTDQVIQSLIALVNDPQPEHPLRADLAEEYSKDRKKFCKNAEEFTKKYGENRPVD
ncbi:hypothetical protein NN561_011978 [Cricetulus griseus]